MAARRIGVFDSGIGGLTVLRALRARLPHESFIYLGDTARLPYGTKSAETVTRYALQAAGALAAREIEFLVIACNTAASAVGLPLLQRTFAPIPVVDVVGPGAAAGVAMSRNGHIAVLATEGTVRGGAYLRAIEQAGGSGFRITQIPCPLFVGLAEEGWTSGDVAEAAARRYLAPITAGPTAERPDTLILGCTHFPALREVIQVVAGPAVRIVDSAETTARRVAELLAQNGGESAQAAPPPRFLATDSPERFARVGSLFLGESIDAQAVELIDLSSGGPSPA